MRIQVNTDRTVEGSRELKRDVKKAVADALSRFNDWVTRVEVHFSDRSLGAQTADAPIRCMLEARPAGLDPVAVSDEGATPDQALSAALKKLVRMLGETADRLREASLGRHPDS